MRAATKYIIWIPLVKPFRLLCLMVLLLVSLPIGLFSQEISAKLDSSAIIIGGPVKLTFTAPNGFDPQNWPVEGLNGIEPLSGFQKLAGIWEITVTAFDSGYYQTGPYPFVNAQNDTAFSNSLAFSADYPPSFHANPDSIAPEMPIWEEAALWSDYFWWYVLAGSILLFALAAYLIYVYLKKKPKKFYTPVVVQRSSDDIALDKLAKLQSEELWQKGNVKGYYSELSHIVREYLEKRYGFSALESTSGQIMAFLRKEWSDKKLLGNMDMLLNGADLVKFAKSTPEESIHEKAMDDAILMVQETKYIPPVNPTAK